MTNADHPSARRQRSRTQLLEVIRRENGITRADLSLVTGLSRSAIADGVSDLLDDRLIAEDVLEAGGRGAGRGRPSALLVPAPSEGAVLGLDFGHDHVAVAVADSHGTVLAEQRNHVNVDDQGRASLDIASGMVSRLLGQVGLHRSDIRSVAAGIPAPLDVRTGGIRSDSILSGWTGLIPAQELEAVLGQPVITVNDADLGAQGELRFGAAKGLRDFIYVKASEGLGASMVLGGVVHRGAVGLAGEIGHIRLSEQGLWCRCGNRGCLETVVSSTFIRERMAAAGITPTDRVFPLAAAASNPVVAATVAEAGRTLGRVLADLCNWLNPAGIVLGGELGTAGAPFVDGVREAITRYAHPAAAEGLEVRSARLGLRSELLGSIAVANHRALYLS